MVIGDDEKEELILKQQLVKEFEIKELGKLKYFLGIKVACSKLFLNGNTFMPCLGTLLSYHTN